MTSGGRVIKVECQCGQRLFRYFKAGRGRLIKCFLDEIRQDYARVVERALGARPACPACGQVLGTIEMIHGRPALKINQGTIKRVRI